MKDINVEAIQDSIKHWESNVKRLKEISELEIIIVNNSDDRLWTIKNSSECIYYDSEHCPLCKHFSEVCFVDCPLTVYGYNCELENSPWDKCSKSMNNFSIIKSAQKMVDVLKEVLDKYILDLSKEKSNV